LPHAEESPSSDMGIRGMLNLEALLSYVPLLHRPVPTAAELRGITIKINNLTFIIPQSRRLRNLHTPTTAHKRTEPSKNDRTQMPPQMTRIRADFSSWMHTALLLSKKPQSAQRTQRKTTTLCALGALCGCSSVLRHTFITI
jgi:hypothetical protein